MCEIFQMGAHTLCWYGGRFCLWALSGINTAWFLVCIHCICIFFLYFVTVLCASFVNYSPTQIRNTCAPNLGRWSFCWNEFYTQLSFPNVWCLCSNCLFIDQIKLFLCFKKFYHRFLSLIAVYKKPTHNRRLSPNNAWDAYASSLGIYVVLFCLRVKIIFMMPCLQ
jgi:hypothetical protein